MSKLTDFLETHEPIRFFKIIKSKRIKLGRWSLVIRIERDEDE